MPAEIYGPEGIGKTSLLSHLAHRPLEQVFPDGELYNDTQTWVEREVGPGTRYLTKLDVSQSGDG